MSERITLRIKSSPRGRQARRVADVIREFRCGGWRLASIELVFGNDRFSHHLVMEREVA